MLKWKWAGSLLSSFSGTVAFTALGNTLLECIFYVKSLIFLLFFLLEDVAVIIHYPGGWDLYSNALGYFLLKAA